MYTPKHPASFQSPSDRGLPRSFRKDANWRPGSRYRVIRIVNELIRLPGIGHSYSQSARPPAAVSLGGTIHKPALVLHRLWRPRFKAAPPVAAHYKLLNRRLRGQPVILAFQVQVEPAFGDRIDFFRTPCRVGTKILVARVDSPFNALLCGQTPTINLCSPALGTCFRIDS